MISGTFHKVVVAAMHINLRDLAPRLVPALLLLAVACGGSQKTVVDARTVRTSGAGTQVAMGASVRTPGIVATYLAQVPNGQVRLETASSVCPRSTLPIQVIPLQDTPFTSMLANGCDYQLYMDLGKQDAAGFTAYYTSGSRMITLQEVRDVLSGTRALPVTLTVFERTTQGQTLNLPTYEVLTGGSAVPGSSAPLPSTDPVSPNFAKIEIEDQSGQKMTFDKVARGKYMLIDISATSCPYCVDLAKEMNASSAFKQIIDSGKCSAATWIAAGSDYNGWKRLFPATTDSGKHSYGVTSVHTASQTAFGFRSANYTPFLFIVDVAAGKLHNNMQGVDLNDFIKLCQTL